MKRPHTATVTAAAAAALLALAGCSSSGSGSVGSAGGSGGSTPAAGSSAAGLTGSITVYAASSLTEAFDTIKKAFIKAHPGVKITITYGASSDLATQIGQGAPADVFASASEKTMKALGSAAPDPTDFVANTLEVAVPAADPGGIHTFDDLSKPGIKIAVCDPAVPCGTVAAEVFQKAKLTVHPTATEADVKATLAAVESGEVDAGLVYVTDVRAAGTKVKGVVIPPDVNASTTYPIATLKTTKNATLAKAFVDYVLSASGQHVLTADGFTRP